MHVHFAAVTPPNPDIAMFNRLVVAHQDNLYNLAYRVLGREQAAREVVEIVLFQAFRRIDLLRTPVHLWLYRYLVDACRDKQRRLGKPRTSPESEGDEAIQTQLNRLPLDLCLAVVLVDMMELDYDQAAAAMNSSRRFVARRVAQARRLLT
jgi:RNA polymerase sigma-70 factor, ECF subfamily